METDSRLLIVEHVLSNPPSGAGASMDFIMAMIGGKERSLLGFKEITGRAGLEVTQLFRSPGSEAAIIECRKV